MRQAGRQTSCKVPMWSVHRWDQEGSGKSKGTCNTFLTFLEPSRT